MSILYYLQSLCPVPAPMDNNAPMLIRLMAAPAAPASRPEAILGLLLLTAFVLWIASVAVRRMQISYGTDWVKIYANTGGLRMTDDGYVDSPPNWTKEEIEAVVSEAHAHRIRVVAHARSDTGVRISIAAGVDSIEHGDSIRPEAAQEMARKGIFLSPTLTVANYVAGPRARAGCAICGELPKIHAKSLANCRKAGVKIAFGTDAGGFPWTEINQAQEFEHEVRLGMTPIEAIRSATTIAAELLGLAGQIGVVAKGAYADIVAVDGDPLQDVSVLTKIDFVMKGGEVVVKP